MTIVLNALSSSIKYLTPHVFAAVSCLSYIHNNPRVASSPRNGILFEKESKNVLRVLSIEGAVGLIIIFES